MAILPVCPGGRPSVRGITLSGSQAKTNKHASPARSRGPSPPHLPPSSDHGQLCNEDYHWWWRSFFTSGSSALYLFLYSILYFYTKLEIVTRTGTVLYFGYMFIISSSFFLLTGTIGFLACFWFVRVIYGAIKVD